MDDEEEVEESLGALLRRMGHEVELVEDGGSAVEAYESARARGVPLMRSSWI